MAVQSFKLLRDVESAPGHRIAVALSLQARLILDGALERDRICRVLRHEFTELVDLTVRHLQDPADVAQDAARLQRAEGDDLRHPIAPISFLYVVDDFVTPVLAEVDIEVRHRDAFGIEKSLEQQPEPDRIEIGDGERVGNERACARAAARPDWNALPLRPLDEIGNDEEVAGILHALDDAELEGQPLVVLVDRVALSGAVPRKPQAETGLGGMAKFLHLIGLARVWSGRKARQDRRQLVRPKRTALRNLDGRDERLRQIGK